MFAKVLAVVCLAAHAIALEQAYQHPTSFVSFNHNHNTVHHIQSSPNHDKPSSPHYSAPALSTPVHAAPVQSNPIHYTGQYSSSFESATVAPARFSTVSSESKSYSAPHSIPVAQYTAPTHPHRAPLVASHQKEEYEPAKYEFAYGVEDHHTGDIHSHKESRQGDKTQGEYSLHEADGTIRTVKYNVDGHSGFVAVVENSGNAKQKY